MGSINISLVNDKAVNDIVSHVDKCGQGSFGWYVGIATDPRKRVFDDHNVSENNGCWIISDAGSEDAARETEQHLLDNWNFKGGPGGGDAPSYVYAYQITNDTSE